MKTLHIICRLSENLLEMLQTEVYDEQNSSFLYYKGVLQNITVGDFSLWLCESQKGTHYLQIRFIERDNFDLNLEACTQYCRKWLLEPTMSTKDVVRTAYKAYQAAVEHEAAERFLYKGEAVYNPHLDVEFLCAKIKQSKETN